MVYVPLGCLRKHLSILETVVDKNASLISAQSQSDDLNQFTAVSVMVYVIDNLGSFKIILDKAACRVLYSALFSNQMN